jgi:LigXa C-terminal domain like
MGTIMDRTEEHLVASDATIVQMRRLLLSAVKNGGAAPGLGIAPPIMANSTVFLPKTLSWDELSREYQHGKTPAAA